MDEPVYSPQTIEPKWQRAWDDAKLFQVDEDSKKKKYFLVEMLPYPSGRIHMGHVRNYTIGDVAARYRMMLGLAVLHPMGWDAFGMPAENAAIKHGVHPAKWTSENIATMREQLKRLGFSYDWRREFATCDPDYYRWEQLLFLRLYERGDVYRKTSAVNWCPSCETVLANEQAAGGFCWRCDSPVESKSLAQWYFKITDYAEELLREIDALHGWPERVRTLQREWIGKAQGATVEFPIAGRNDRIAVFTTRPDTIFGVTFLSISAEHPLALELVTDEATRSALRGFIEKCSHVSHDARIHNSYEKEGFFTGASCVNPLSGESVPICVSNYVLMDYGTGAVMGVPAHDQRDFEFAKKYDLPIKVVVEPEGRILHPKALTQAFADSGKLVESAQFSGMASEEAIPAISELLKQKAFGGPATTFRLRDWCLSRQRYWGTPIPIIHCEHCGIVPVPEKELPVVLPHDVEFTGTGGSPLAKAASFVNAKCPKCKKPARRETDTMDTFVESSWYFFRYTSPKYDKAPFDRKKVTYWFPIDQYIGGIEHASGHLIYCRYFTKLLRDIGFLSFGEPVDHLMTQGMVVKDGAKMSKSKGNVVDPDMLIEKYGADTVRLFSLFAAPPEKDLEWSDAGVEGAARFLQRVWRFVHQWKRSFKGEGGDDRQDELLRLQHRTIKRVSDDIERWHFNTAIAALMEYINALSKEDLAHLPPAAIETLVLLLSPFAPHCAEELWREVLGKGTFLLKEPWPRYDEALIVAEVIQIIVQVNGKLRDRLTASRDADEAAIQAMAFASEKVVQHLGGKEPQRIIYVPHKLLNIVV